MGSKPPGGTLISGDDDSKVYPKIYLTDADTAVVGDHEVGHEVMGTLKVRISSVGKAADGSRDVSLEVLELTLAEEGKSSTAATRMYPTMGGD